MKTVVFGVIGAGVIAPTHIESLQRLEGVRVKYVSDLIPGKAAALASRYGIAHAVSDNQSIFSDPEVDCVSVCTDHASHAELAIAAMRHGKHVICEKPLSSSLDKLMAMTGEHARHPELCFSGIFQHRYEPTNCYLKKLIDTGAFGRILTVAMNVSCLRTNEYYASAAWRGTQAFEGGGVLINQAIHHIDLMRFLFGEVAEVGAQCANQTHGDAIEVEDAAAFAVRFTSGALGAVTATSSSAAMPWRNVFIITGTAGYLEYVDLQPGFMKFSDAAMEAQVKEGFAACKLDPALRVGKDYYGGGHPAEYADLVETIRAGRAPYISGEDAARTAKLVLSCYDAHRLSTWIRL